MFHLEKIIKDAVTAAVREALAEHDIIVDRRPLYIRRASAGASVQHIIEEVAKTRGTTARAIFSKQRGDFLVAARHAAIRAVADARPDLSLPDMGKIFGKDHTSILYALRKTAKPGQHHRQQEVQE